MATPDAVGDDDPSAVTMSKALVSYGTGPLGPVLDLALPSFREFAQRHGYEIVIAQPDSAGRPLAWGKIRVIERLLENYDVVLWVDADAVFLDTSVDPNDVTPPDAFQALVRTTSYPEYGTDSPCTGVWLLRAGDRSKRFLAEVWNRTEYINHQWWEQASVMDIL